MGNPPGAGDHHGCPYRHYDEDHLSSLLSQVSNLNRLVEACSTELPFLWLVRVWYKCRDENFFMTFFYFCVYDV